MPIYATIPTGFCTKLNATIGAALTAVSSAMVFAFQPKPGGGDFSAVFQVVGTVTSLVSSLQMSLDGGTTWVDFVAAASFLATATTVATVTPVIGGALFRINATTLTGSQDFWVCSN